MKNKILFLIAGILIVGGAGFYVDGRLKESGMAFEANPAQPSVVAENTTQATSSDGKTSPAKTEAAAPKIDFQSYGKAPDFIGINKWLNSDALTMESLRGKVVLVDFWTYSCINCIRTLPYVTKWYDTYKNDGLVVVGVHTPEFAFEKDSGNVLDAIKRFGIHYPVAQDNDYKTWINYNNRYWPAEYLIDKNGNIVYKHFGEGEYDVTENTIRALLGMAAAESGTPAASVGGVTSPEMYFGTARLQNLAFGQSASLSPKDYSLPAELPVNTFALEGNWQFNPESVKLVGNQGKIKLKFHAAKVHIVASSASQTELTITVDGKSQSGITVKNSELYTLFDSNDYSDHIIEISISTPGFEAFTFTFG